MHTMAHAMHTKTSRAYLRQKIILLLCPVRNARCKDGYRRCHVVYARSMRLIMPASTSARTLFRTYMYHTKLFHSQSFPQLYIQPLSSIIKVCLPVFVTVVLRNNICFAYALPMAFGSSLDSTLSYVIVAIQLTSSSISETCHRLQPVRTALYIASELPTASELPKT